jgi:glycosyltransferase involved in cell wall biosynthesis
MIPEVSAVVPTKDRWPLLERALRSVLAQDGVAVEAVVVDDGSTDGTRERLDAWDDPRVRYLRHEHSEGVSRARNRGTEAARAPYVAFLDDDDVWAPDHLNRLLSALPPAGSFAFARHYVVDLGGRILSRGADPEPEGLYELILSRNPVVTPSAVLARRDAVSAAGGFDPRFSITADWDMWIRLGQQGPVGVSRALTVGYTVHHTSMRTDVDRLLRERAALEEKHRELLRRHRTGLGDELFWQWIASTRAPSAQRRLAARWYLRHQRRFAPPWRMASGLARLARAPLLADDGLLRTSEEPSPPWLRPAG